jgi:hypothetical protein
MSNEKVSLAQHGCKILDASIGHFNSPHLPMYAFFCGHRPYNLSKVQYYHYYSRTKLENVRIKKTQQPYLPLAHQRKTPHQNLNHTSPKPYTPWQHGDC